MSAREYELVQAAVGHVLQHIDNRLALGKLGRVDEVRRAHLAQDLLLLGTVRRLLDHLLLETPIQDPLHVDGDDARGRHRLGALDDRQADRAARAKDRDVVFALLEPRLLRRCSVSAFESAPPTGRHTNKDRDLPSRHATAEQTGLLQRGLLGDLDDRVL